MRFTFIIFLFLNLVVFHAQSLGSELLLRPQKVISTKDGQIPQAPRVSPDGKQLAFEYYADKRVVLWTASADGANADCLTCAWGKNLENAYWHPSGKYIVFNQLPDDGVKNKDILVGEIREGKLSNMYKVASGARPQFSKPNGHVIFYEVIEGVGGRNYQGKYNNIIAYKILGEDPTDPPDTAQIELRGPIQKVNMNSEVSHPSLAPDGTTIIFAARSSGIKSDNKIHLDDTDRQKIYKLWQNLIKNRNSNKIAKELAVIGKYNEKIIDDDFDEDGREVVKEKRQTATPDPDAFSYVMNDQEFLQQPTIVSGYTKRHFYFAYLLGLLDKLDAKYDLEVQEFIFPRLWTTDVFGAPIIPLVKDIRSTPLPQKWPTVSQDGRFVVFEAGHYSNRHIYLVAKKKDQWLDKAIRKFGLKRGEEWMETAIRITESGTYNSSPELDPTGQWLYFESNRDGTKGIWRAKLNWPEINKRLGL